MPHCERPRAHSLNFDKPYRGRGGYFLFGLIFIKKKNKKKNKTGSNRVVLVWFDFLEKKPFQTRLARFFCLTRFFRFGSVFFCLGSVRFFQFQTYKTEPNRSVFLKF
jgi:hypothetical protein